MMTMGKKLRLVLLWTAVVLMGAGIAAGIYIATLVGSAKRFSRTGQHKKEITALDQLIRINDLAGDTGSPGAMPHVYLMRGLAYERQGQYAQARESLEKAVSLYEKSPTDQDMLPLVRKVLEDVSAKVK